MTSRNNTYEIDKVRICIFVYALMNLFNTIMMLILYFFLTDEMDEIG